MTWAEGAAKHDIPHEDALHAIGHAYHVESELDEPRVPGRVRPTLFIWPPRRASATALRGEAAATFGRDLLERATGGRPSIDPKARPGQQSPVRQVRLPAEVNDQLAALAHAEHRSPSDVIRAALADYIAAHNAG